MEDKVIQQSFTFKNSDRMTAQAKKTATNIQKRKWQVKEIELISAQELKGKFEQNGGNHD